MRISAPFSTCPLRSARIAIGSFVGSVCEGWPPLESAIGLPTLEPPGTAFVV